MFDNDKDINERIKIAKETIAKVPAEGHYHVRAIYNKLKALNTRGYKQNIFYNIISNNGGKDQLLEMGLLLNSTEIIDAIYKERKDYIENKLADTSSETLTERGKILFLLYAGISDKELKEQRKNQLLENPQFFTPEFVQGVVNVWHGNSLYDEDEKYNIGIISGFLSQCQKSFNEKAEQMSLEDLSCWNNFLRCKRYYHTYNPPEEYKQCNVNLLSLQKAIFLQSIAKLKKSQGNDEGVKSFSGSLDLSEYIMSALAEGSCDQNQQLSENLNSLFTALQQKNARVPFSVAAIDKLLFEGILNKDNISAISIDSIYQFLINARDAEGMVNLLFYECHDTLNEVCENQERCQNFFEKLIGKHWDTYPNLFLQIIDKGTVSA